MRRFVPVSRRRPRRASIRHLSRHQSRRQASPIDRFHEFITSYSLHSFRFQFNRDITLHNTQQRRPKTRKTFQIPRARLRVSRIQRAPLNHHHALTTPHHHQSHPPDSHTSSLPANTSYTPSSRPSEARSVRVDASRARSSHPPHPSLDNPTAGTPHRARAWRQTNARRAHLHARSRARGRFRRTTPRFWDP